LVERGSTIAILLCVAFAAQAQQAVQPLVSPPMSLATATNAALQQVSEFQQAQIDEQIAAEDLRQARTALLPRVRDAFTVTYNSPAHRPQGGIDPSIPSFIGANAIHEYENLLGVTGDLNFGLFAAITRARAMLRAAHAGTEIARRAFIRGVSDVYYSAALATARRRTAEQSLAAAEEFERITTLNVKAGEVPEVDAIRARLQTAARRDEVAQAIRDEAIANASLGTLLGSGIVTPPSIEVLPPTVDSSDIETLAAAGVARRPEFAQLAAQTEAARADISVARADFLPRITYSVDTGFDAPSLASDSIDEHRGVLATANIDVPIFDWGATRSRLRQAELRAQATEVQRQLLMRDLYLQFATARQEAITAAERVENARRAVGDAERDVSISIAQYRAGEGPISLATDAQTTLAAQRLALQQALYDYQIARAHLREAAGE
jgi:outer membrane protein